MRAAFACLKTETWTLEKGKRYFTTRNGSSVLAFSVPEKL